MVLECVDGDYPDPGVTRIGGSYYLVATGGGQAGAFRMLRSADLIHWEPCGQVFSSESLPCWSGGAHGEKCDYWAPEMHQLPDGRSAVFFSAREPSPGRALHIGVATADHPEGPYHDSGQPLVSDPHWAIDATYFYDKGTGKQYLLWKIDFNAHSVPSVIKMRELNAAGVAPAEGSEAVELICNDLPWEGKVVEGPFLIQRGQYYYLFYSGECYANHRYCVGVARAEQVTGPYEKAAAPVLASGRGFAGPGHCVVVAAPGGDVMVYHAWPADSPGGRGARGAKRQVLAERVIWERTIVSPTLKRLSPMPTRSSLKHWIFRTSRVTPKIFTRNSLAVGSSKAQDKLTDWGAYLGYAGKLTPSKDEAYVIRPGLRPGGTVSLEAKPGFRAVARPGHFMRPEGEQSDQHESLPWRSTFSHRCGKLEPLGIWLRAWSNNASCGLCYMDGSSADARDVAPAASSREAQAPGECRIFEINVKQIDGSSTPVTVRSGLSGWALKELLAEKLGVPAERQRLICRGRAIQDDDPLDAHVTQNGQTLHMVQRPLDPIRSDSGASGASSSNAPAPPGPGFPFNLPVFQNGPPPFGPPPPPHAIHVVAPMPHPEMPQGIGSFFAGPHPGMAMPLAMPGPIPQVVPPMPQPSYVPPVLQQPPQGSETTPPAAPAARPQLPQTPQLGPQGQPHSQPQAPAGPEVAGLASMSGPVMFAPPGAVRAMPVPVKSPPIFQMPGAPVHKAPAPFPYYAPPFGVATAGQFMPAHAVPMPPPTPAMPPFAHFAPVQSSMQFWVQQGLGHLAAADPFQGLMPHLMGPGAPEMEENGLEGRGPQPPIPPSPREREPPSHLPWREICRLHLHLSRALGRPSMPQLTPPPPSSFSNELSYYLSLLHSSTSQLGVAISDIQRAMAEDGPTARQRANFTDTLSSASRTFRSLHRALRNAPPDGDSAPESTTLPDEEGEEEELPMALDEELRDADYETSGRSLFSDADSDAARPRPQADRRQGRRREPWNLDELEKDDEDAGAFANAFDREFPTLSDVHAVNLLCYAYHRVVRATGFDSSPHNPHDYPSHLLHGYILAVLNDMGQNLDGNNAFRSMPDAAIRYPHLRWLMDLLH
ncbi:abn-ts [Symbiodinium natans]|uniref:Abn-ts protein n=1 Tax=Symbiodinium natans TaxID=878477 RepID=A0A812UJ28_9DINO|nr:abn-ts [Symbiodinium natans]